MPRIRTIKPEFWSDEKLGPMDPLDRLVFLGLVSMADDAGRLVDSVRQLDGLMFPYTNDTCAEALENLARISRVRRYTSASGQRLIQIEGWERHQRVDKPAKYVLPAPQAQSVAAQSIEEHSRDPREILARSSRPDLRPTTYDQLARPETKKAQTPSKKRKTALPDGWQPTDAHRERAERDRLNLDREADRFRNHHEAKGSTFVDWDKAFSNWLSRAQDFAPATKRQDTPPPSAQPFGKGGFYVGG